MEATALAINPTWAAMDAAGWRFQPAQCLGGRRIFVVLFPPNIARKIPIPATILPRHLHHAYKHAAPWSTQELEMLSCIEREPGAKIVLQAMNEAAALAASTPAAAPAARSTARL